MLAVYRVPDNSVAFIAQALNTILGGCSKAFDFKAARALLDRMKDGEFCMPRTSQPIYPDEISYSLLLSSCRDPNAAKSILKEVRVCQPVFR
jgi:pentatricopeptide repeat protein